MQQEVHQSLQQYACLSASGHRQAESQLVRVCGKVSQGFSGFQYVLSEGFSCFAEFGLSGVAGSSPQGHGGDAVGTRRSQEILETTEVPNVSGGTWSAAPG